MWRFAVDSTLVPQFEQLNANQFSELILFGNNNSGIRSNLGSRTGWKRIIYTVLLMGETTLVPRGVVPNLEWGTGQGCLSLGGLIGGRRPNKIDWPHLSNIQKCTPAVDIGHFLNIGAKLKKFLANFSRES